MSVNGGAVTITSKHSGGWRDLLSGAGVRSVSVAGAGSWPDNAAPQIVLEGDHELVAQRLNRSVSPGATFCRAAAREARYVMEGSRTWDRRADRLYTDEICYDSGAVHRDDRAQAKVVAQSIGDGPQVSGAEQAVLGGGHPLLCI